MQIYQPLYLIRITFIARNQRSIDNLLIKMAKKISKASRKPKLTRSSSIEKTIDEGKDYVTRADRRLRIRRAAPKVAPKAAQPKPKRVAPKKAKATKPRRRPTGVTNLPARPAVASLPASVPAPVVAPAPVAVARTGSRNVARTGSQNVVRSASKNNQIIIEQELQDRLGRHNANIGKLNFSLRWWDPNDLDLHVVCPCNTEISFMNKKCHKCGGELDIDMNVGMNMSLEPVEHVFFSNPKPGLYKFYVQYYSGPKQFQGVKGAEKSKYALSLHEDMNQIFRYEDTVSLSQRQMHYDFNR